MAKLPEIASLWIGGQLSWLEQLCLKSFADAGHHITLYSYSPIPNIPEGVHAGDAADIFPGEPMYTHARTGSPAIHADIWRLQLLKKTSKIWVDADIYCYRTFDYKSKFVFGWEKPGLVCNAVLGLPKNSKTLNALLKFFKDEYAIGPWLNDDLQAELKAEKDAGTPVHMTEQNWGFTGPASVTYFLQQTGEIEHAQPVPAFYPISFKERNQMIMSRHRPEDSLTDDTRAVHFWARRMKPRLEEKEHNTPRRGSFMAKLIDKHGIDPGAAPIPAKVQKKHPQADEPGFRDMIGTMVLSGEASVDKASRKFLVETRFVKDCLAEARAAKETPVTPPIVGESHGVDVGGLDYSMFDDWALVNLVQHRSEVIADVPNKGKLTKQWLAGDPEPLNALVAARGPDLASNAMQLIADEFDLLSPILAGIPTGRVADIGCGYGMFGLLMSRVFGSELALLDIEEYAAEDFGFADQSLVSQKRPTTEAFLHENGVAASDVTVLDAQRDDWMAIEPVDIAISLLACGFHFPLASYAAFFAENVKPGGHIILDLRQRTMDVDRIELEKLGRLTILEETKKKARVLVSKA